MQENSFSDLFCFLLLFAKGKRTEDWKVVKSSEYKTVFSCPLFHNVLLKMTSGGRIANWNKSFWDFSEDTFAFLESPFYSCVSEKWSELGYRWTEETGLYKGVRDFTLLVLQHFLSIFHHKKLVQWLPLSLALPAQVSCLCQVSLLDGFPCS